jgi:hypothetical protein
MGFRIAIRDEDVAGQFVDVVQRQSDVIVQGTSNPSLRGLRPHSLLINGVVGKWRGAL